MLDYEKKFKNLLIAGIDEAGRGPLAGPVVCACVIMPLDKNSIIEGINDSKKLTEKKRDALYDQIKQKAIVYSIVEVDEKTIDEINILNATKLGMKRALDGLSVRPDIVLIDAVRLDTEIMQENIIKGDALSYNIASASILAKVYRDRLMKAYDEKYPNYQFGKHKGYGTKLHIEMLKKFGKSPIHRDSFIKNFVDKSA
ncbi:MAG: ribonuclease HII [Clostridia bacterium]|nr:ribonuclease HII [Clostridia bacterium]